MTIEDQKLRFETNIRGCSKDTAIAYSPDGGMASTTTDEIDETVWAAAVKRGFGIGETTPTIVWERGKPVVITKPTVNSPTIAHIEDDAARMIVEKRRQQHISR